MLILWANIQKRHFMIESHVSLQSDFAVKLEYLAFLLYKFLYLYYL